MPPSPDELAGAVDLFGGLTRDELRRGFEDLAARGGWTFDAERFDAALDDARERYYLVVIEQDGDRLLVPGPAALPTLPPGGEDLPHLLEIGPRAIERQDLETAVERRIREEAATAINDGDDVSADRLLDTCFDAEAWGSLDLGDVRDALAELSA